VTPAPNDIPNGGAVSPGYEAVQQEFVAGLGGFDDGGGGFAAYVGGRPVVDLWGGYARPGEDWATDSRAVIMSTTKGMVTMCAAILYDRHLLDIEAPVSTYWPEFAQNGKASVTVRHFLTHTSGVLGFDDRPHLTWSGEGWDDYDAIAAGLAAAAPRWEPGTKFGYHAMTYGWLMGEVVRRITGQTVGRFFADEVAGPLQLEVNIGTPPDVQPRVAQVDDHLTEGMPLVMRLMLRRGLRRLHNPKSLSGQAFLADGTSSLMDHAMDLFNGGLALGLEIPSGNGTATARGLARVYAALAMGGELDGVRLLSPETVAQFGAEVQELPDQLMSEILPFGLSRLVMRPVRRTAGFLLNPRMGKEPPHFGPNPAAFGHDGAGGQIAFCDVEPQVSVGFVRNAMTSSSAYSTSVISRLYECARAHPAPEPLRRAELPDHTAT
jgi:CubicO group peptidase (beta-lactamase class C family)